MKYILFKDGQEINRIVASQTFIEKYCTDNGYIYEIEETKDNIEMLKSFKEKEISNICNSTITAGVDVETTQGTEHFSLEETDQINLTTANNAVTNGMQSYPYHSDGNLCRMFTAEEIINISNASIQYILYHRTLCNHILTWIRRSETKEEIEKISYREDVLPEDLRENMSAVLASSQNV